MQLIVLYIVILSLFSCSKLSTSTKKTEEPVTDSSFICEKYFQADWCSSNLETTSNITSVCSGNIFYEDIIYKSVYLKSNSGNTCLIDLGHGAEVVNVNGCSYAVKNQLSGPSGLVDVISCYDTSGANSYVEGINSNGDLFRANHFQ